MLRLLSYEGRRVLRENVCSLTPLYLFPAHKHLRNLPGMKYEYTNISVEAPWPQWRTVSIYHIFTETLKQVIILYPVRDNIAVISVFP